MSKPLMDYILEPSLIFAYNQSAKDPRDGITLFGPFDHNRLIGMKTIGIIGPEHLRIKMKDYLKKIHSCIINQKDLARPDYPGLQAAFGISINFLNIQEINISSESIENNLNNKDEYQRVHNLSNLYVERLIEYKEKYEMPVDIWFIVIPEAIYRFGRPRSQIPYSANTYNDGIPIKNRFSDESFLFDYMQQRYATLMKAYEYKVNFHNQIKAKILPYSIATQIIRESKITFNNSLIKSQIEYERKSETSKAWNISTALYYKLGGLPWRLKDVRKGVCYLGLVYNKTSPGEESTNACCAAQMFLDDGDGMIFRGNVGPWLNPETKEFHLDKKSAIDIISQALKMYYDRFSQYPSELFIHAKTFFDDIEWSGFTEAIGDNKSKLVGVRISGSTPFKLYRQGNFCVPRGTILQYGRNKAFLWTKGYIPRLQNQIGLETPNPLDIRITHGETDIKIVCRDILSLSKLNYNTCMYGDGLPITLKFANSIGEILTTGKDVKSGILPFRYYI
jgi:hypothetical protein